MRHELSDGEWAAIKPMLPNKPRGVARINDRPVLIMVFSGSCDRESPVVICPGRLARTPHAPTGSSVGEGLGLGQHHRRTCRCPRFRCDVLRQAGNLVSFSFAIHHMEPIRCCWPSHGRPTHPGVAEWD
jgi:hypothetical protein